MTLAPLPPGETLPPATPAPVSFVFPLLCFGGLGGEKVGGGRGKRCGVGGLVCLCVRAFCVYLGLGLPLVVVTVCALVHPGRGARGQEGVGGQKGPAVEVRV